LLHVAGNAVLLGLTLLALRAYSRALQAKADAIRTQIVKPPQIVGGSD